MEPVVKSSTSFGSLKAALEEIEAREKYRAITKSPSDGEEIRWYFSKTPLSLKDQAASRPTTEVVGKSDFLRFSVNDSLALEAAFLKQEEELVSAWWKEFAECSEGPLVKEPVLPSQKDNSKSGAVNGTSKQYNDIELYQNDEMIGVPVKGGLYEVDLLKRRCYPVYWNGNHRRVLRGHWFAQRGGLDWLPLREDVSEQLEFAYRSRIWHRRTFQPSGKFAARVNLQSSIEGLHALFTGEDDTWEAWLDIDASGISSVLSFRSNKIKLRRGFAPSQSPQPTQDELQQRKEEEMDDYCSQVPVRHLVFMVHGIGQRLENANLIDDVGTFRHTATILSEQHLTSFQRNRQRVLYIPCQWRRGLKLGGEEAVESCTLEGVRALRTMLSATVHDVLYYMSPVYCQDIIDSVSGRLNMLYQKFIKRNPGYDGKVSIYGHSLGSVLSYDILCHQKNLISSFPISQINQNVEVNDSKRNFGEECNLNPHRTANDDTEVGKLQREIARLNEKIASLQRPRSSSQHPVSEDEFCSESEDRTKSHQYAHSGADHSSGVDVAEDELVQDIMHSTDNGSLDANGSVVKPPHNISTDIAGSAKDKDNLGQGRKDRLKKKYSSRKRYTPYIEYTKLDFEVDTFFAVGSPLGVFLSLRNVRLGTGQGKDYWQDDGIEEEMPSCKRMFNIFHPFDPVAYRVEPLICKEYLNLQPEFIPYHKGGRRLHIGMQELSKDFSARSKAFVHSISVVGDRVVKALSGQKDDGNQDIIVPKERTYGTMIIEKLTGDPDGRVDYMLQDATFEHQYLQAISSHTSYWQDPDTALFIIKHLYHDIPEEDPALKNNMVMQSVENSTITTEPTPLSDQIDEDLALTFSRKESGCLSNPDLNHKRVADEDLAYTFSGGILESNA